MAAQVARSVGASWALLFSPVYIPGHPAQCDCPTLVAYDSADEVVAATRRLLAELPLAHHEVRHDYGHRLPPAAASSWWRTIALFLQQQMKAH